MNNVNLEKVIFYLIIILYIPFLNYGFIFTARFLDEGGHSIVSLFNVLINSLMLCSLLFIRSNRNRKKSLPYLLIVLWFLYMLFQTFVTSESLDRIFKNVNYVSFWTLSFLYVYKIIRNKTIDSQIVVRGFVILFWFSCVCFVNIWYQRLTYFHGIELGGGMNHSYYLLCLLPWGLLLKKKKYTYVLVAVCFFLVLLSTKRTSLISLLLIIMVFSYSQVRKGSVVLRYSVFFILIAAFAYAFIYVEEQFLEGSIQARFERAQDDEMGKRPIIWARVIQLYEDSPIAEKLVGHGHNTTVDATGMDFSAHNDYLETLYDYGMIALIIQIAIIISLLFKIRPLWRMDQKYALPFTASILVYLPLSISSHLILYPYYFMFLSGLWGFALAKYDTYKFSKNI